MLPVRFCQSSVGGYLFMVKHNQGSYLHNFIKIFSAIWSFIVKTHFEMKEAKFHFPY